LVYQGFTHELAHMFPEMASHNNDREALQFASLYESKHLECFVKRTEPSRHDDKGRRVFDENDFADEKLLKLIKSIKIRFGHLLLRELDIAAETQSTCFFGSAIRRFHNTGSAASHDRVSGTR